MENAMTKATAWMIKNDGAEIPVTTHIYADEEEFDELLALAYFLWEHDPGSHQIVLKYLGDWVRSILKCQPPKNKHIWDAIDEAVKEYLSLKPYRIFPNSFAEVIANNAVQVHCLSSNEFLPVEGIDLIDTLNQRFLRARYGGRKNTVQGCRDMYFRPSSIGYDWFPIIRGFVERHTDMIETVTIVRDFESTGCEKYYIDAKKRSYNKMPVSDFLAGSGNTNYLNKSKTDSHFNVHEVLANGGAVQQLRFIQMDYGKVRRKIEILKFKEEACLADE